MLKQTTNQKLPTFLQWARENDAREDSAQFALLRIMWGDEYKTITFVTEEFRYSLKFGGEKDYQAAGYEILDAFQPTKVLCCFLDYDGDSREMDIIIREATEEDNEFICKGKQSDWGIIFTPCKKEPPKQRPARQKKRSAKADDTNSPE